jgi:hypothetical protein
MAGHWNDLSPTFKLIVTSRDERIPTSFRRVCKPIEIRTGSLVSDETTSDIRRFLTARFADIADQYSSLSNWPGKSTIKRLTMRAAGLFIWAETLIRFVDNKTNLPDEQLELVRVIPSVGPTNESLMSHSMEQTLVYSRHSGQS